MNNGNDAPNLRGIIREGRVSAVYPERNTIRVTFPDRDDLVSGELQLITSFAGGNKKYSMPDIDEVVVCAMATNDELGGTGYVLGSVFNEKDLPNSNNHDETKITFSDGTEITYNRGSHQLNINAAGDITINAQGNIKMTANRIDLN